MGQRRDASFFLVRYDFVGSSQDRWWYRETDRFCGFEINHEFEFGRLRKGKLGRAGTLQYLVHVTRTIRYSSGTLTPYDIRPPESTSSRRVNIPGKRCWSWKSTILWTFCC